MRRRTTYGPPTSRADDSVPGPVGGVTPRTTQGDLTYPLRHESAIALHELMHLDPRGVIRSYTKGQARR